MCMPCSLAACSCSPTDANGGIVKTTLGTPLKFVLILFPLSRLAATLMKINEDRAKFGLPAVKLGENNAAQAMQTIY